MVLTAFASIGATGGITGRSIAPLGWAAAANDAVGNDTVGNDTRARRVPRPEGAEHLLFRAVPDEDVLGQVRRGPRAGRSSRDTAPDVGAADRRPGAPQAGHDCSAVS